MSHTDPELFELCKEVYEKTGWQDEGNTAISYHRTKTGDYELDNGKPAYYLGLDNIKLAFIPLYTSDYLLEKLPQAVYEKGSKPKERIQFDLRLETPTEWAFFYNDNYTSKYWSEADIPLKALLKLTIALHKAGELK